MDIHAFMGTETFTWVVLPLLIFLARILDVTVGTLRIIFVARGNRLLAPILGFFEVFVWLLAIGQIMRNLDNVLCYIAYAGGFATGNFVGIWIEQKLALGKLMVRIITKRNADVLIANLRRKGFGVTSVDAEGSQGPVSVVFLVIKRIDLELVIQDIEIHNPNAFYTIEDTRFVRAGIFRRSRGYVERKVRRPFRLLMNPRLFRRLRAWRKGK